MVVSTMSTLTERHGSEVALLREPARRPRRRRVFAATLIVTAVLGLGGAGFAGAQMPGGSAAAAGAGAYAHCH
jgi:hypothetical protein